MTITSAFSPTTLSFFLHLSLFCLTSVLHQYAVTVLSDMTLLNTVNLFRCHHTLLSINPFSPVQPLSMLLKSSCFILFSCSTDINLTFLCLGSQRFELCLCKIIIAILLTSYFTILGNF